MTAAFLAVLTPEQKQKYLPRLAAGEGVRGAMHARTRELDGDVRPGELFVAVPGTQQDGAEFVADALRAGAAAVCATAPVAGVPTLVADDPRKALADLAAAYYRWPARDVALVGITGTLGKTSTALLTQACLAGGRVRVGVIGSLGVLDDVTVTQSATVTELAVANPGYGFRQLYGSATRIGRAHIAYLPAEHLHLSGVLATVTALIEVGRRVVVALPEDGELVPRIRACGAEVEFLDFPVLRDTLTDSHFRSRDRLGRLVAFLARLSQALF